MSTATSQAKALVSALIHTRPTVLSLAAREAVWQQKKGQISRASLDLALSALQALGWEGQAPAPTSPPIAEEDLKESEFVIAYTCENCARGLVDTETYGPEAAIRIELERRARSRLKLHSDLDDKGCMGILVPRGLLLK